MKTGGLSLEQAPPVDIPFRFFLTAPVFGIAAGLFVVVRGIELFQTTWHLESIALVHLITLGWLAMIMIGAFYQMVPVLVGKQVPYIHLARVVHAFFILGVLALVLGLFLNSELFYQATSVCLTISLLIFITQISGAVFKVKADLPVVVAMRISITSLAFTLLFGLLLVGFFAGWWTFPVHRVAVKAGHVTLGLLGWIGCLVLGVGFHVIPMFYLTSSFPKARAKWILRGIMSSLLFVALGFLTESKNIWIVLAGIPGLFGVLVFAETIYVMLKKRKRKIIDTTLRFWQVGLAAFPLSFFFLFASSLLQDEKALFLFSILFLVGFALSITNGMLYKIVPFLLWFHRFSSLAGEPGVPLLKDILPDSLAKRQWQLFVVMFLLFLAGLIFQSDLLFRLGGGFFVLSSGLLFNNIYRAMKINSDFDVTTQACSHAERKLP